MTPLPPAKGIDIDYPYQSFSISDAKAAGYEFAIIKVSESTTYTNPMAATWIAEARALRFRIGTYHLFHGGGSAEGRYYVDTCHRVGYWPTPGDLLPALDVETVSDMPPGECDLWAAFVRHTFAIDRTIHYANGDVLANGFVTPAYVAATDLWQASAQDPVIHPWRVASLVQIGSSDNLPQRTDVDHIVDGAAPFIPTLLKRPRWNIYLDGKFSGWTVSPRLYVTLHPRLFYQYETVEFDDRLR